MFCMIVHECNEGYFIYIVRNENVPSKINIWRYNKMAVTLKNTFSNIFSWKKYMYFDSISLTFVSSGSHNWQEVSVVQVMAWYRRQDRP